MCVRNNGQCAPFPPQPVRPLLPAKGWNAHTRSFFFFFFFHPKGSAHPTSLLIAPWSKTRGDRLTYFTPKKGPPYLCACVRVYSLVFLPHSFSSFPLTNKTLRVHHAPLAMASPSVLFLIAPASFSFLSKLHFFPWYVLYILQRNSPPFGGRKQRYQQERNEKRVFLKLDSLSLSATCYTTRMRGGACCSHQKQNLLSEAGSNHLIYIRLLAAAAGALWMGQRSGNRCSRRRWRGQPVLGLDLAQLVSPNPPHLTRLNLSSEIPTQNVLTLRPSSKVGGANNTWLYLVDFLIFVRNTKRGPPSKRAGRRIDEVKTGI